MSNKSDQYVICLKQYPLSLYYKRIIVVNFSSGYTWPSRGTKTHWTKAQRPNMSPPDRNRNPDNSRPTVFFLCRHLCLLHLRILLIISSHTFIAICLSVVFNITQDNSVCLSASYSAAHKMSEFASLFHIQQHTRRQSLPL